MNDACLKVSEIFTSIQGESSRAGRPCFFVRLAGCNLDCKFCDTPYARDVATAKETRVAEILRLAGDSGVSLAEVTGGEPMLQQNTPLLCGGLLELGMEVLVETNGSLPLDSLPKGVRKIMDCKTPSSGEEKSLLADNFRSLGPDDEIKFVISDRRDFDFAVGLARENRLEKITRNLLFSPAWGAMEPSELAKWMIEEKTNGRLNLQLHKLIWGPERRGV